MGQISESYASPGLRLGLLLEDHPDATYTFEVKSGAELGIPPRFGGDGDFCVCTITFAGGRSKAQAYKALPAKGDAETWNTICTKTLGRALKRAGYPDDLRDLKALVLWRQRDAEISAIRAGAAQVSLPSAQVMAELPAADPVQRALDEAAVRDPEQVGVDEDADVIDVPSMRDRVAALIAGLDRDERERFGRFLEMIGAPADVDRMSEEQLGEVLVWLDPDA